MRDFFKTTRFKILLVLIAAVIIIMINSLTKGGYLTGGVSVFSAITEPFQKISTAISEKVSSSLDMLFNAEKYYNDNEQLRNILNDMYNDIIDYDKIKRENEELRVMLELKEEFEDYKFSAPCKIIARVTNDPYGAFKIDRGSDDGITPNLPVITSQGLVGVTYDVAAKSCYVRTLFSPRTAVGATFLDGKSIGVLEGDYELSDKGFCKVNYINKDAAIKDGDIVMTTGGENFPSGQLIGTVVRSGIEESGLSKYAVIRPAIDPYSVTDVFVILSFSGKESN